MIGVAITVWPFLWSINQKNVPLLFITSILMVVISTPVTRERVRDVQRAVLDPGAHVRGGGRNPVRFRARRFRPRHRCRARRRCLQSWVPVAIFACATAVVAAIAAAFMRETYKTHLNDLGKRTPLPNQT